MSEIELVDLVSLKDESIVAKRRPPMLHTLPVEIQILIFYRLRYLDLYQLNRVNRYFRSLITDDLIRECFTPLQWDAGLRSVCRECRRPKPDRKLLIALDIEAFKQPLGSYCVQCAVQTGLLRPRAKLFVAPSTSARTVACRWCAWPTWTEREFHHECAYKYLELIEATRWLVLARTTISWTGCSLGWSNFHSDSRVLIPTVVAIVFMSGLNIATYGEYYGVKYYRTWAIIEFLIMCFFVLPTVSMVMIIQAGDKQSPMRIALVCLVFFALNMAVRLVSIIGNMVLYYGYDESCRFRPRVPAMKKVTNLILTGLVFWVSHHSTRDVWDGDEFLTENRKVHLPLRRKLALVWTLGAWKLRHRREKGSDLA